MRMFEKLLDKVELWTEVYSGVRGECLQEFTSGKIHTGKCSISDWFGNLQLLELKYLIPICVLSNCGFLSMYKLKETPALSWKQLPYNTYGLSVTSLFHLFLNSLPYRQGMFLFYKEVLYIHYLYIYI